MQIFEWILPSSLPLIQSVRFLCLYQLMKSLNGKNTVNKKSKIFRTFPDFPFTFYLDVLIADSEIAQEEWNRVITVFYKLKGVETKKEKWGQLHFENDISIFAILITKTFEFPMILFYDQPSFHHQLPLSFPLISFSTIDF